jgi:hypothetical protein
VASHFEKSAPAVLAIYKGILKTARGLGSVREDPKKTSIHLVRETAFAGIATRKEALILTLKSAKAVKTPRIHRQEQVSSHRWHLEIRLVEPSEVDPEIRELLRAAYELS